ncbi:MAG: exodeoxyribonuclease V subunit alpha [Desulfuromonas sp.]|nr:MAG: exodeoxyribonuclease V subunit alpha [Desulfuromonas sp.]
MRDDATFSPLGEGFAKLLDRLQGETIPELNLAAHLVCAAVNRGHVCLNLASAFTGESYLQQDEHQDSPPSWSLANWRSRLLASRVVGQPGELRPLILDQANRLYLYRYWEYEKALAEGLVRRSHDNSASKNQRLAEIVERYFPDQDESTPDWQRVAALLAATRSFTVICGGPGTGKTTTVVRILALLLELSDHTPLSIALAAPTGKAAARLKSSISKAKGDLPCREDLRQQIPEDVRTLHRLLGSRHLSPYFRHDADNPLPFDVVVVDEASMVDLPMMAKLVCALPPHARLILLGDKNQLASVEAGAVLGDICRTGTDTLFSETMQRTLGPLLKLPDTAYDFTVESGLTDSLVTLQRNYRFAADSGISQLAQAVNDGASQQAEQLLDSTDANGISWVDCPEQSKLAPALKEQIINGFSPYLITATVAEAFSAFSRFMILCALRNGPFGVADVSLMAERILAQNRLIQPETRWYKGRPIMVTANDYRLGLFNGDTGIIWPDPDRDGQLRAFFPDASGALRSLAPARLPSHETVFACTVHKSQGSEFDQVLLLLPPHDSRALTRELVYTGITRAKQSVQLWGSRETLRLALGRRVQRTSALREAIWRDDENKPSA